MSKLDSLREILSQLDRAEVEEGELADELRKLARAAKSVEKVEEPDKTEDGSAH